MSAGEMQYLLSVMSQAEQVGHGQKTMLYQEAANQLCISIQTLMRKIGALRSTGRRRRSDAGVSALTREEAQKIAAYMLDSRRKNGKRLASLEEAVEVLRSNDEIEASIINSETGEYTQMSISAISRAMYQYGLHPEMLCQPSPKMTLRSLHPNHVWEIDPSLCVLYYLPSKSGESLQVMAEDKFYKNKPANIKRIENDRVWRYVITDHASGVVFVHYVLGAESGVNLLEAFIQAVTKRENDPFHGIPKMVMVDPGSANTGSVFRNLCRTLDIKLQVNVPGQPWAKGQVENANNLVERSFEHRLKFEKQPPTSIEELNALANMWMRWFNSHKTHSRTKQSRYAVWMRITVDQLRLAPDKAVMRAIAMSKPEPRKVSVHMEISFRGKRFSVADIPGVYVGKTLEVTRNPWSDDRAGVLYQDEHGHELIQIVQAIETNEYGFDVSSPAIGETYKRHADTELDINRKQVERIAMDAETDSEAAAKRKAGATPFAGRLDPMKPITETDVPDYLPRKGLQLEVNAPTVQSLRLNHVEAARHLRDRIGDAWNGDHYGWLVQRYPAGVAEDELDQIAETLQRQQPAALRVIGGV